MPREARLETRTKEGTTSGFCFVFRRGRADTEGPRHMAADGRRSTEPDTLWGRITWTEGTARKKPLPVASAQHLEAPSDILGEEPPP